MAFNGVGQQPAGANGVTITRTDDADLPGWHGHRGLGADTEDVGVDAVLAGGQDIDLGAFLAAVDEKAFTVLKGVVRIDVAPEDAAAKALRTWR